jgi:hypothetical protein
MFGKYYFILAKIGSSSRMTGRDDFQRLAVDAQPGAR